MFCSENRLSWVLNDNRRNCFLATWVKILGLENRSKCRQIINDDICLTFWFLRLTLGPSPPRLVAIKNELDPRPDRSYYMLALELFWGNLKMWRINKLCTERANSNVNGHCKYIFLTYFYIACSALLFVRTWCYNILSGVFLKGTVSRDFLLLVFFLNQFPPSLWLYH